MVCLVIVISNQLLLQTTFYMINIHLSGSFVHFIYRLTVGFN